MKTIAIILLIIIVLLLLEVLLMPQGKRRKPKKKKMPVESQENNKDFEEVIQRRDRLIRSLKQNIAALEKEKNEMDKQFVIEKAKTKKFQEKLSQERGWHEKEQDSVDKKNKEFQQLKQEFSRLQDNFSKEHVVNLKLDHNVKDLSLEIDSLKETRRSLESENNELNMKTTIYRSEIAHLKKDVAVLTKKKDDTAWIAKSEYIKVEKLLKEKEKELERVEREIKKNSN